MKSISIDQVSILLVEPSVTQQRIISDQLGKLGIQRIDTVRDGESALDDMTMHPPDLVISAMHLPDITGTELVQRMRGDSMLRDIAFMLISSETQFRYLDPIRQAGVIAILPKPFAPEQLQRALYTTLDFLDPEALQLSTYSAEELNVLVVDDSSTARRFIKKVLGKLGIEQIKEAENGLQARNLIEHDFFDLIVTDYNMPEMDGAELVAYIREQSNQAGVPILMVSSESDEGRLAAVQQSGVSAICDKPFEVDNVRGLIEKMLS